MYSVTQLKKHLGFYLDEKLNLNTHIRQKISQASKGIGIIENLFKILPRNSLLTILKSFISPHLNYGDIVYDQPHNETFISKFEQFQYNDALAITGATKCTSRSKVYKELGLESLESRRRLRRLSFLHKIVSNGRPAYLYVNASEITSINNWESQGIASCQWRTDAFKFSFFL